VIKRIEAEIRDAMRAGDARRRDALRLLLDALRKEEKEARAPLDEKASVAVLRRERKRRLEAATAYRDAGAADRAAAEEAEAAICDEFLPAELDDGALAAIVDEAVERTGADSQKQMGLVMREAMSAVAGRADGKRVQALVRERLGA
jgi:uncharacterized protein YqeY